MADFRTRSEMGSENDFIQALERLVSGNANTDSSASGTYETGINRPLGRLSRNTDALLDAVQTAKGCFLKAASGDETIEYTSANALKVTGTTGIDILTANNVEAATYNRISPGVSLVSSLAAGDVLYVELDRSTNGAAVTIQRTAGWAAYITATKGLSDRLNYLVIGVVTSANSLVLLNGQTIRKGERLENGFATDTQYASRFNVQQNANIFMTGGGNLTFSGNNFAHASDFTISVPGGGVGNGSITVAANSYILNSGEALYVTDLNRDASAGAVTPQTGPIDGITISNTTRDLFVIAYRSGSVLYLANGASIQDGETYRLASSPVYALKVDDETSGTPTDMDGTLTLKSAAGTVVDGSTSSSHIRIRNRRDNQFVAVTFPGTKLSWNSSTGVLEFSGTITPENGLRVFHPDYGSGFANNINPSSALLIADGSAAYVALSVASSADINHINVITGSPGSTPGNIYVDPIEDVVENDAEIFVFAYRKGSKLYLWDGTFLEDTDYVVPGQTYDRAIIGQQYSYSHGDIVFRYDRSGGTLKTTVSWSTPISLRWPSGGVTTVNTTSGLDLKNSAPVIRVTVPLSDRGPSSTSTVSASAGVRSSIQSVEEIILFAGHEDANAPGGYPWNATSVAQAQVRPIQVFGGRLVYQNYERSGGATGGTTGSVNLGRDSTLTMTGQESTQQGLHEASYPSGSNPFVTSNHGEDFAVGTYSGAEYEGGSATFAPKYEVTSATGATTSRAAQQATDFTFGTSGGATQTKKRKVFLSALDIFRQLDTSIDRRLYTSDISGSDPALPSVVVLKFNPDGDLATGNSIGPALHGLEMAEDDVLRFPYVIPTGCSLDTITLFWAETTAANDSYVRVSLSEHISSIASILAGSYTQTTRSTLLTNGTATTTIDSETFADATSTSTGGPVKRAVFDFTNAAVSNSGTSKQVTSPLQRLYIGVVHSVGSAKTLVGISIEYTADSVAALLGIQDA